jgi:predicted N-formylglutamate amidohydrolase
LPYSIGYPYLIWQANLMKKIVLTCEHGGAQIPAPYKKLFLKKASVLKTHRGLDIGALPVALELKEILKAPLIFSVVSRLLIDLNRLLVSPTLFSEFTEPLEETEKNKIIEAYYRPHWQKLDQTFRGLVSKKHQVFHIGVHSMTDNFHGNKRHMQLALLYNPKRKAEKQFAKIWIEELRKEFPDFIIARNNPYEGKNGGVTSFFRKEFSENQYVGVELEINQGFFSSIKTDKKRRQFSLSLASALKLAVERAQYQRK